MPVKLRYTPEQYFAVTSTLYAALVAPVNSRWGEAIESGSRALPELYAELRWRWEGGHVAAFALWLAGYGCLQWFALAGHAHGSRAETTPRR